MTDYTLPCDGGAYGYKGVPLGIAEEPGACGPHCEVCRELLRHVEARENEPLQTS